MDVLVDLTSLTSPEGKEVFAFKLDAIVTGADAQPKAVVSSLLTANPSRLASPLSEVVVTVASSPPPGPAEMVLVPYVKGSISSFFSLKNEVIVMTDAKDTDTGTSAKKAKTTEKQPTLYDLITRSKMPPSLLSRASAVVVAGKPAVPVVDRRVGYKIKRAAVPSDDSAGSSLSSSLASGAAGASSASSSSLALSAPLPSSIKRSGGAGGAQEDVARLVITLETSFNDVQERVYALALPLLGSAKARGFAAGICCGSDGYASVDVMEAERAASLATIGKEEQYRELELMLSTTSGLELHKRALFPRILKLNNESVGNKYGAPSDGGTVKYAPKGVELWGLPLTDDARGSRVAYSALNESCALSCLPPLVRAHFGLGNASAGSVSHGDRMTGGEAASELKVNFDSEGKPCDFSVSCEETLKFHVGGGSSVVLTGGVDCTAGIVAAIKSLAVFTLVVPVDIRLGEHFESVSRDLLFAVLSNGRGSIVQWQSVHGMNLPSHKHEVAADYALAGILARVRMQRAWLERMLKQNALGIAGHFDSEKGGASSSLQENAHVPVLTHTPFPRIITEQALRAA